MNTKIYVKTRWENIYRHKTNKNYVIRFNGKVETSVSKDERGNKIFDSETARRIRDNQIIINQKKVKLSIKSWLMTTGIDILKNANIWKNKHTIL